MVNPIIKGLGRQVSPTPKSRTGKAGRGACPHLGGVNRGFAAGLCRAGGTWACSLRVGPSLHVPTVLLPSEEAVPLFGVAEQRLQPFWNTVT